MTEDVIRNWNRGGRPPDMVNEVRVWSLQGFCDALARHEGKAHIEVPALRPVTYLGIPVVLDRGLPDGVVELRNAAGEVTRIEGVG